MLKTALFDLDDTLYPELEFVKSGFEAVAGFLAARFSMDRQMLLTRMCEILQKDGRGRVFDTLLEEIGLHSSDRAQVLLQVYRSHKPVIEPYPDAICLLDNLKRSGVVLGMVTDGMASVQRRKIASLGFDTLFDAIVCSDELGRDCWKPSSAPFKVALDLLNSTPAEAVYVGNDPAKDFIAPNAMGMLTIQVDRRPNGSLRPKPAKSASLVNPQIVVSTLDEVHSLITGRTSTLM